MKTGRLFSLVASAALAAGLHGCSNSGGNVVVPAGGGVVQPVPAESHFAAEHIKIKEFSDLPQYGPYYFPSAVTVGPDNSLWVTDNIDQDVGESAVARVATSGKLVNTYYYGGITSEGSYFNDIAAGSDGALWLTDEYNDQILRLTTDGTFTGFPLHDSDPVGIVAGPDKALWFANGTNGDGVGRITTQGQITTYGAGPSLDIAVGSDGALWCTEYSANQIGRVTTKGKISGYSKGISSGAEPYSIAPGPDGALWFTEYAGGRIGRITTSGKVTEYSRGITPSEHPIDLAAGPDHAMWFTEYELQNSYPSNARIGRITMDGKITEYAGFDSTSEPTSIVQGPKGDMWFVESATDRMGRVRI
ncbi:MAG TPA: hypothetical protein VKR56_04665 [Candidatus Cybelea sp.]|nr:hypothetical protein [Candidatus Cybelea sp.]